MSKRSNVRINFEPMVHIKNVAKGERIEVREFSLDGEDYLGDFSVPMDDIMAFIINENTEIIHCYNDTMCLIVEISEEEKLEWDEL